MNDATARRIDDIARQVLSRATTYRHALFLVSQLIPEDDAWTPIVVLSDAILNRVDR